MLVRCEDADGRAEDDGHLSDDAGRARAQLLDDGPIDQRANTNAQKEYAAHEHKL